MSTHSRRQVSLFVWLALGCGVAAAAPPPPFADPIASSSAAPTRIDKEGFVSIGGIEQWVAIHGADASAPVLIVLHGGPGAAWSGFPVPQFSEWEKKFVLVLWDQRGAGRTFARSGPVGADVTIERMARDGVDLAEHVRRQLHRQRVILMGVSWGSVVGVRMVKQRPDLFAAYVGSGQIVSWRQNEAVAYQQVLARARGNANREAIIALEAIGPPPYHDLRSLGVRSNWAARFEPGAPTGPELMKMPFSAPGYSEQDAKAWLEGLESSQEHFFGVRMDGEFARDDLTALGRDFSIPLLIVQGTEDDIAPASLAESYVRSLHAPMAEFVPIAGAGHYAFITRSDAVLDVLVKRVRPLVAAERH